MQNLTHTTGTLRNDRLKIVEGGKIRYGRSTSGHAGAFRLWPTLKRANMCAKARTSVRARGGCKTSDAGCKGKNSCKGKVGCATDGTKPLNFSNQAIAARLSGELGPLRGVGVSKSALTQKLKYSLFLLIKRVALSDKSFPL